MGAPACGSACSGLHSFARVHKTDFKLLMRRIGQEILAAKHGAIQRGAGSRRGSRGGVAAKPLRQVNVHLHALHVELPHLRVVSQQGLKTVEVGVGNLVVQ